MSTNRPIVEVVFNAVTADENHISSPVKFALNYAWNVQIKAVDLDANDATVTIEHSNDGVEWSTYNNQAVLPIDTQNVCAFDSIFAALYWRLNYDAGSNTQGTLSAILTMKI